MATGRLAQYIAASLLHILAAIGMPVHARCALQSRNLCGWISGEFLLCHLHLGCPGATDSSRIRHPCSSPSPCCHRPTSRLTHHFRARLHHYMVVAGKVTTSCTRVL